MTTMSSVRSIGTSGRIRAVAGRAGAATAAVALAGLGLVGTAGTASAAPCGTVKDTYVHDLGFFGPKVVGEAHYTITCSSGQVLVTGRVVDAEADGKCVESRVVAGTKSYLFRACGKGNQTPIDVRRPGDNAQVFTYRL